MTRIYSLVFDYQIAKMQSSGRHWADSAYKNKEYIFEYSAASIASYLEHNAHLPYDVYTDDVALLRAKLDAYDVNSENLRLIEAKDKIERWTSHWYCFWPLIQVADMHYMSDEDALKLDNDLTYTKSLDEYLSILEGGKALVWKHERLCSKGRDYWGESYAARNGLGTDNFNIYNTGVLGVPKAFHEQARKIPFYCEKLISVDISPVHRFPDKPGVVSKVFNTSDQVAVNYFFHEANLPVVETHPQIIHHCYEKTKNGVLQSASHLLKQYRK